MHKITKKIIKDGVVNLQSSHLDGERVDARIVKCKRRRPSTAAHVGVKHQSLARVQHVVPRIGGRDLVVTSERSEGGGVELARHASVLGRV